MATPNFPGVIQNDLDLPYEPECALCHGHGEGGGDTANTPFALTLKSRGMVPYNTYSLTSALDSIAQDEVDTAGDGTPDIEDLQAGSDPSVPQDGGELPPSPELPEYGCSVSHPQTPLPSELFYTLPLLALLLIRRKKSR
ncbi:MAG: hypothetical protein IPJ88_05215 [Myxococcales bacterium]|nr:MAG: hypothetical protein IPJ88_05215 [Myxococcales bacterium]